MEAISLKEAGVACIAVLAAAIAVSRSSKVDLRDLPAGSLFEVDVLSACFVTGARDGDRCQCLFTSSGGQGYELWLHEAEVLKGVATLVGDGLIQPEGEGGIYLRQQEPGVLEWPLSDSVGSIPAGAQVRHVRRLQLVALQDVHDGNRRCRHYEDQSVDEWLSLQLEVSRKRHAGVHRVSD